MFSRIPVFYTRRRRSWGRLAIRSHSVRWIPGTKQLIRSSCTWPSTLSLSSYLSAPSYGCLTKPSICITPGYSCSLFFFPESLTQLQRHWGELKKNSVNSVYFLSGSAALTKLPLAIIWATISWFYAIPFLRFGPLCFFLALRILSVWWSSVSDDHFSPGLLENLNIWVAFVSIMWVRNKSL